MTDKAALYEAMFVAENRMEKALRAAYGYDAAEARYDLKRNAATLELADARNAYHSAHKAYFDAVRSAQLAA
jgi:hypothetical protein